jgi:predicted enzyme related to lactoylglutathione lyase
MIKISSILIGVSDLKKARPFYEKVFGFVFDEFRPPFASAMLGDTEFNIEEDAEYRHSEWGKKNVGGRKSVTFEVDDLEAFLNVVVQEGGVVIEKPEKQPWGWYNAVIADLDGNEFVVEKQA